MRTTQELRDDYRRMDATWERPLPEMTFEEAQEAVKRLVRRFRPSNPKMTVPIKRTRGRNRGGIARSFRQGTRYLVNCERGWDALVHILSHHIFGGHSDKHHAKEWEMIKHVRKNGWLTGALKPKAKPEKPVVPLVERRAQKAHRTLQRAEIDFKRAQKRVKAWSAKVRYYDKKLAA